MVVTLNKKETDAYRAGEKAGRKEVVEAIDSFMAKTSTKKERIEWWQVQKKKWRIE